MAGPAKSRTKKEKPCVRKGGSVSEIKEAILDNLVCIQGRFSPVATRNDYYLAVAYTVRDRLLSRWAKTAHTYYEKASRTVCYLSAEFLLGPHLENHLLNLGLYDPFRQAVEELGLDFRERSTRRRSRDWGTAASDAWLRAISIRSRHRTSRRSATGSATNSASSPR
jgi:glucan phosphorylase